MNHRNILRDETRLERFYASFDRHLKKDVGPRGHCWEWTGETRRGYGFAVVEVKGRRYKFRAHRVAWERKHGSVPRGKVIDHTCTNGLCVRLSHLEPVSNSENVRRGNAHRYGSNPGYECRNGHRDEYKRDPKSGKLYCLGCARDRMAAHYWKKKAA